MRFGERFSSLYYAEDGTVKLAIFFNELRSSVRWREAVRCIVLTNEAILVTRRFIMRCSSILLLFPYEVLQCRN